jgi:beta-1,4-N-acetylglucosaminyltransferase
MQVYRSREVGQSYITSVGTTIVASMHSLWIVFKLRPQVVLLFFFVETYFMY